MRRRSALRLAVPFVLAAFVTTADAGPGWLSTSQPATAAYAYWAYWHGEDAEWEYSRVGPASHNAKAGTVEGWSFNPAGTGGPRDEPPRPKPDPNVCKGEVTVYIDDSKETPRALCAKPDDGLQVLRSVATVKVADDGLICSIDAVPKSGCGEVVADPSPEPTIAPTPSATATTASPKPTATANPKPPPTATTRPKPPAPPEPQPSPTRNAPTEEAAPTGPSTGGTGPSASKSTTPEPRDAGTRPADPDTKSPPNSLPTATSTSTSTSTPTPTPTLTSTAEPLPDSAFVPDIEQLLTPGGDAASLQPLVAAPVGPQPTPTPTLLVGPAAEAAASTDDDAGSPIAAGLGVLTLAGLAGAGIHTARRRQHDA